MLETDVIPAASRKAERLWELQRAMPRATTKVLREQLRQMVADDLITREELAPRHLGVRYAVSAHGETLGPVFDTLWRWGVIHLARDGNGRGTAVAAPFGSIGHECASPIRTRSRTAQR